MATATSRHDAATGAATLAELCDAALKALKAAPNSRNAREAAMSAVSAACERAEAESSLTPAGARALAPLLAAAVSVPSIRVSPLAPRLQRLVARLGVGAAARWAALCMGFLIGGQEVAAPPSRPAALMAQLGFDAATLAEARAAELERILPRRWRKRAREASAPALLSDPLPPAVAHVPTLAIAAAECADCGEGAREVLREVAAKSPRLALLLGPTDAARRIAVAVSAVRAAPLQTREETEAAMRRMVSDQSGGEEEMERKEGATTMISLAAVAVLTELLLVAEEAATRRSEPALLRVLGALQRVISHACDALGVSMVSLALSGEQSRSLGSLLARASATPPSLETLEALTSGGEATRRVCLRFPAWLGEALAADEARGAAWARWVLGAGTTADAAAAVARGERTEPATAWTQTAAMLWRCSSALSSRAEAALRQDAE